MRICGHFRKLGSVNINMSTQGLLRSKHVDIDHNNLTFMGGEDYLQCVES